MKRIRKRIFAAVLAAVVVITMPGTAAYALEENGQTEYISDISTEPEEANATEEPETENDDIKKPETEDSGTEEPKAETGDTEEKEPDTEEATVEEPDSISQEDKEECICETVCTEDSVNEECPVCSAEDADLSDCKGEKTEEEHSDETPKRTQASGAKMLAGEVSAAYQEASWDGSAVTYTDKTADDCTPVVNSAEAVTWDAGWYVVSGTVTISQPITVSGAVNLILADGCTLNAAQGIVVASGNSLTIYAQAGGTGTLNATGVADDMKTSASAGIGGSAEAPNSGAVTIHGGTITATGSGTEWGGIGGAGIGGGTPMLGNGGSSGAITIYGGIVTANSGEGEATGAGIGGGVGRSADAGGAGSNIIIYGGTVNATGGRMGAGIGGGASEGGNGGAGSNIEIHGGSVNATGGNMGAGIGGGGSGKTSGDGTGITISGGEVTAVGGKYAAGIGGGGGFSFSSSNYFGGTGTGISITGGIVDAQGGAGNSSGDYAGDPIGNGGNASGDAVVTRTAGIIFENGEGKVYGTVTLDEPYIVPEGYSLTFTAGSKIIGELIVPGAVAKVEIDGDVIGYLSESDFVGVSGVFMEESYAGATVTLMDDLQPGSDSVSGTACSAMVDIICTLDLAGHKFTSDDVAIYILPRGDLTIQDSSFGKTGQVVSTNDAAIRVDGISTLDGGTYISQNAGAIYVDGCLSVTNKDVKIEGKTYGLDIRGSSGVDISAGTYSSIKVSNNATLGGILSSSGSTRYAYFNGTTPILMADWQSKTELTGPVTVAECKHDAEGVAQYQPNDGMQAQTHTLTCLACGYTNEAEDCDYGAEYKYDDTNHWLTCTLCGYEKAEAHVWRAVERPEEGNVTTNCQECIYCRHTKDHVTVTVIVPTDLTYGQTEGKKLTYTVSPEKECDKVVWKLLDKNADWYEVADGALPAVLSVGSYFCQVEGSISDGTRVFGASTIFTVTPAPLMPSIDTSGGAPAKTYDGTTTVSSDGLSIKLEGIVGDDVVTATAASYEYDSADAGVRTIIAGGITLSGEDAGNYKLSDDTARIDGTIDKAAGTLTVPETLFSKKYGEEDFSLQCSTNGDGEISYVSDDENVATVSADGMVHIKGMGEARVTVSLAEGRNYTAAADRTVTITVDMGEVPEGLWISGLTRSVPYTGSAIKPEGISVYHGTTLLREKTEYTISYKSNTNAGTAQLIVTGKGNYKGKCTAEFTIEPVDLSADSGIMATIATVTETGKNLKPAVTVTWNGKKLKEKKDYTLSYETGIKTASEEGYAVTISGKGNYTGSIERRFYVRPRGTKLLSSAKVTGIKKSYEYQSSEMNDGNEGAQGQNALPKGLEADLKNITVKIGKVTLTKDDYTVRTENTEAVGTGCVVIEPTQTSDYAGEKRITFNIIGTNIKKCFITGLEKSYPYTGKPIMPEIKVYTGKKGTGTQIPSDAYTVSYSNYTNQGKATVTVTGIPEKGCSGSVKATYSIGRLNLATGKETGSITVTMPDDIKYAKGGAKPQPVLIHSDNGVIRILRESVDYTLKYSNNTAKYSSTSTGSTKKPTLKITGIGNYTGTITENYDINVQDISKLEITVADKAYNSKKKGNYYYSVPKVYDFDGKLLKSGKDYTVGYNNEATGQPIGKTDIIENGTQIRVTVTAKENSNYEGTLSRTYLVRDAKDVKDISKVKFDKIAAQQYTGSSIEPEVKLYTMTGKTKNYLTEEDYEIIGYYNNIKRGTATVLIRGTGVYCGVKSITFKITPADNKLIWFGIF